MTILKNEPCFPFEEGNYAKPRHVVVSGKNEEIGYDLARLAKDEYGCTLHEYVDPIYGEARREYFKRNWPAMHERTKGVLRAYGLPQDDNTHDASNLPYDLYDMVSGHTLAFASCSAVVLPIEKSESGKGVFTSRNHDLCPLPVWSTILGKAPPEGAHGFNERPHVLEVRPEAGYKSIIVGGHDLMTPFIDGINEKGMYFSIFADPNGIGEAAGHTSGGRLNGLTNIQLGTHVLNTCATVEEAKKAVLTNRVIQVGMCIHLLFADRHGNATIFEIDKSSQTYVFVDRKPGEPLFVTNHPVSTYPDPSTYPKYGKDAEHNSFARMNLLHGAYAEMKPKFRKPDATQLIDQVRCAFVDSKKAQAMVDERTLINTTCDLSKPEISVRFYLGDAGPIAGTNHMQTRMSEAVTFGF